MSSAKKRKRKSVGAADLSAVGEKVAAQGVSNSFNKNILWVTPATCFLAALFGSSLMKYPVGFGIAFGCVNGSIAFFAAVFLTDTGALGRKKMILEDKGVLTAISAALSALALLLVLAARGMQPFGDLTVVGGDMASQYIPFTALRNDRLLSGGSLTYSDGFGLGGSLWAVFAYYTSSPFTLLSLPVSLRYMPEFMCFAQIAKTAAAGGAFAYFYLEKYRRSDFSVCVFSLMYSLMTFFMSNLLNVIWLDCFWLLPLIILGVERLINGRSAALYTVGLALAIFSNYYIAFFICIYLVLYYALYIFTSTGKFEAGAQLRLLAKFALCSILAAGMAAASLLPSVNALTQTAPNYEKWWANGILNYDPFSLIGKFLWGSYLDYFNHTLPNVYISIFGVVMLPFFWICKDISRKKKWGYTLLFAFITLSTMFAVTNFAWHGFHVTIGLPYRYSFLISFTVILMTAELWEYIGEAGFNAIMAVLGGFTLVILADNLWSADSSTTAFAVSMTFMLPAIALILLNSEKHINKNAFALLAVMLVFSDLTMSGIDTLQRVDAANSFWHKSEYTYWLDMNEALTDKIKASDDGIYRIDDENYSINNQGVYFDHSALTGYSTPNNGSVVTLMSKLGYAGDFINKYVFNLYTPFSDSVLNLKYIMSGDSSERKHLKLTELSENGKNVYENELVLPRAFAVSSDVESWSLESDDPFELQNELGRLASGDEEGVYDIIDRENGDGKFMISGGKYTAVYTMPRDGDLFCYFKCTECDNIKLYLNDIKYEFVGTLSCVFPLYEVSCGDVLRIEFFGDDGIMGFASAALQNDAELLSTLEKMGENGMSFERYEDGFVEGSIAVEDDCLLFTSIPYDMGWNVQLDGRPAETVKIGGGLIGIKLHEGENHIILSFCDRSVSLGLVMSSLSVLIFVFCFVLMKQKKLINFCNARFKINYK